MSNVKNYTEQGGEKTVIGGSLEISAGGKLKIVEGATIEGILSVPVVDALDSTSATSALSANQGKVLNDAIAGIESVTVVDALDSTSATSALSANQGQVLNNALAAKTAASQADSTATEVAGLVTDFNALLAKLKAAGLMVAE